METLNAKQEAIKKAYAEYWEYVKNNIDENGYLNEYFLSNPYFVSPYKYIGDDIARRGTKYPAYIEVK